MAEEIDLFKTPTEPSFFIGQVQSEIFTSPDSFFKVLIVSVEEANFDWHEPEITVTGSFGDLSDDQTYRFEGKIVEHPRYGQQFQATSYHVNRPTSKDGLIDFLSGKQFTGIGKKTAEKIVDKLGTDAINKIIADPHILDELKLRKTIKDSLVDNLRANQGMDQIIIGLNDLGFGANLSSAIFDKYGEETLHIINENPYQLAAEIDGISFNRADQVAQKLGIATDDSRRIDAAIIQTLDDLTMETGDTFTKTKPLLQQTIQLLAQGSGGRVSTDLIANQIVEYEQDNMNESTKRFKQDYQATVNNLTKELLECKDNQEQNHNFLLQLSKTFTSTSILLKNEDSSRIKTGGSLKKELGNNNISSKGICVTNNSKKKWNSKRTIRGYHKP